MGPRANAPIKDGTSLISTFIKVGASQGSGNSKNMSIKDITPNTEILTMVLVFHVSLLNVYIDESLQIFNFFGILLGYKNPEGNLRGTKID